jgi:hypothetical protein
MKMFINRLSADISPLEHADKIVGAYRPPGQERSRKRQCAKGRLPERQAPTAQIPPIFGQ